MLHRILIVVAMTLCLLVLPGCLDEDAKSRVEDVQAWTEARLNEPGELLVVRRSDLERNREHLDAVLTSSSQDWSGIEALLTLLGVGGAGAVVTIKKLLKWRSIAWEAISGMEKSKVGTPDGKYVLDKKRLRSSMSSATAKEIERIRAQVNGELVTQAAAAKIRADLAAASVKFPVEPPDPTSTAG